RLLLPDDGPELLAGHVGHHFRRRRTHLFHKRLHLLEPLHHLPNLAGLAVQDFANQIHTTSFRAAPTRTAALARTLARRTASATLRLRRALSPAIRDPRSKRDSGSRRAARSR